jgi:hypothetical protein
MSTSSAIRTRCLVGVAENGQAAAIRSSGASWIASASCNAVRTSVVLGSLGAVNGARS